VATFIAAIFLSAGAVVPDRAMFTKMVLPRLAARLRCVGAMVFFQTMLLAGYRYAHVLTATLPAGCPLPSTWW